MNYKLVKDFTVGSLSHEKQQFKNRPVAPANFLCLYCCRRSPHAGLILLIASCPSAVHETPDVM